MLSQSDLVDGFGQTDPAGQGVGDGEPAAQSLGDTHVVTVDEFGQYEPRGHWADVIEPAGQLVACVGPGATITCALPYNQNSSISMYM